MVEGQSWTTRRGSNPRLESSAADQVLDIPATPTDEVRNNSHINAIGSILSPNLLTTLIIASWYLSNIGVLLLNKYLLSFYGYRYPIFLTMLHMLSCAGYSLAAIRWLEIVPLQHILSRRQFLKILALSAIFCFSVVCGNTSLRYLPVSFNQAIGATTPFFTAIFAFLITCKKESAEVYLALLPVVFGIVLASNSEPLFHLFGFLVCVGSTAGRALKSAGNFGLKSTVSNFSSSETEEVKKSNKPRRSGRSSDFGSVAVHAVFLKDPGLRVLDLVVTEFSDEHRLTAEPRYNTCRFGRRP
ncbi:hypothetical protein U1Q18_021322 [Sarracenia purpurea var. burkii]